MSTPVTSPAHHVRKLVNILDAGMLPERKRLLTPNVEFIRQLIGPPKSMNKKMALSSAKGFGKLANLRTKYAPTIA